MSAYILTICRVVLLRSPRNHAPSYVRRFPKTCDAGGQPNTVQSSGRQSNALELGQSRGGAWADPAVGDWSIIPRGSVHGWKIISPVIESVPIQDWLIPSEKNGWNSSGFFTTMETSSGMILQSYPLVNVYSLRTWTWWFIVDIYQIAMVSFHMLTTFTRGDKIFGLLGEWGVRHLKTGWWFGTSILFSHILGIIIPIDVHIFQRGGPTTKQKTTAGIQRCRECGRWVTLRASPSAGMTPQHWRWDVSVTIWGCFRHQNTYYCWRWSISPS